MKKLYTLAIPLLASLAFTAPAHAYLIDEDDCSTAATFAADDCEFLDDAAQPSISEIETLTGFIDLELFYRDNVGGLEEGPFAGSYETLFSPTTDPTGGTVTYVGGPSISCPDCVFEVKDGNAGIWYFNLNTWDGLWNGTEQITFQDFFPDQGAISHISIYGNTTLTVPAPGVLGLLGIGLLGLFAASRRKT